MEQYVSSQIETTRQLKIYTLIGYKVGTVIVRLSEKVTKSLTKVVSIKSYLCCTCSPSQPQSSCWMIQHQSV